MKYNKVILTDVDGVLLNWEYAFNCWFEQHGFGEKYGIYQGNPESYDIGERYGLDKQRKTELVRFFNESAAIGFLPPLRDAMYFVDLMHRKHGYVFHIITSLSLDPSAQALRISNIKKLFGETAFEKFIFCDTGADKDEALAEYEGSGFYWLEDKTENAECGLKFGLKPILIHHPHNVDCDNPDVIVCEDWSDIVDEILG